MFYNIYTWVGGGGAPWRLWLGIGGVRWGGTPTGEGAGKAPKAAGRLGKHQPTQPVAEGVAAEVRRLRHEGAASVESQNRAARTTTAGRPRGPPWRVGGASGRCVYSNRGSGEGGRRILLRKLRGRVVKELSKGVLKRSNSDFIKTQTEKRLLPRGELVHPWRESSISTTD